ncbi:MAG: HD-GYP domain-containing protein [Armatimonadetes bacterium]|nr:HD-GYP domain-containing protein [Armatimonadota bacterium]
MGDKYDSLSKNLIGELEKAQTELERKAFQLATSFEVAKELVSDQTLENRLNLALYNCMGLMGARSGAVLLQTQDSTLDLRSFKGFSPASSDPFTLSLNVFLERDIVKEPRNLHPEQVDGIWRPFFHEYRNKIQGFPSKIWIPLVVKERLIGFLCLGERLNSQGYSKEDQEWLATIASQAAVAIQNAILQDQNKELLLATIRSLAAAIDARDRYTAGHSGRVAASSFKIARLLEVDLAKARLIKEAGLLHDVGKIGVSEAILNKPGALTVEEYNTMKKHPVWSAQIITPLKQILPITSGVLHHHEWYNGNGYPDSLAGENIPWEARIITVADCFDAMTSNRSYRPALTVEHAIEELKNGAGSQFDPYIVELVTAAINDGNFPFVLEGQIVDLQL